MNTERNGTVRQRWFRLLVLGAMLGGIPFWLACRKPAEDTPAEKPQPAAPQKAEVGVGRATQRMAKHGQGFVATPAAALFKTKEKIAFEIQIPHALNLYKATNGRGPRTHEEFMKEIIEANDIKLPELPAGRVYRFRPDLQELWVEDAAPASAEQ